MSNEIRDSKLSTYDSRILEASSGLFGYFTKTSFKIIKEVLAQFGDPFAAIAIEGGITTYISHLEQKRLYILIREYVDGEIEKVLKEHEDKGRIDLLNASVQYALRSYRQEDIKRVAHIVLDALKGEEIDIVEAEVYLSISIDLTNTEIKVFAKLYNYFSEKKVSDITLDKMVNIMDGFSIHLLLPVLQRLSSKGILLSSPTAMELQEIDNVIDGKTEQEKLTVNAFTYSKSELGEGLIKYFQNEF